MRQWRVDGLGDVVLDVLYCNVRWRCLLLSSEVQFRARVLPYRGRDISLQRWCSIHGLEVRMWMWYEVRYVICG